MFDGNPVGSLTISSNAKIVVTYLGKEAGWTNYAFSTGAGQEISTAGGATSYFADILAGIVDFALRSSEGTSAGSSGVAVGSAAVGFSALFNNNRSVYAFFDDSGAANDRDFDDMVVRIDIAAVPVPAAGFLLVGALAGLAGFRPRKG